MTSVWESFLACTGILLLLLNVAGLFMDHRAPELHAPDGPFRHDISLDSRQARDALVAAGRLQGLEKATRVTRIIAQATAHSNGSSGPAVTTLTPWTGNWLLRLLGEAEPMMTWAGVPQGTFSFFQYQNPWRALERGMGMCGQLAVILSGVLNDMGMESGVLGLHGHVVAYARQGGEEWILDPDFDVVVPFGTEEVCDRIDEVETLYTLARSGRLPNKTVQSIYCGEYRKLLAAERGAYRPRLYLVERGVYALKWLVPPLLLFPLASRLRRAKRG